MLIRSDTRYVPTAVNMIVLQGEDGAYYYLLFMDENNRVSIGGESPRMLVDAVECSDVRLYKSLISTNRPAIYMSKSGPKFL